jgi:hypothetical protein
MLNLPCVIFIPKNTTNSQRCSPAHYGPWCLPYMPQLGIFARCSWFLEYAVELVLFLCLLFYRLCIYHFTYLRNLTYVMCYFIGRRVGFTCRDHDWFQLGRGRVWRGEDLQGNDSGSIGLFIYGIFPLCLLYLVMLFVSSWAHLAAPKCSLIKISHTRHSKPPHQWTFICLSFMPMNVRSQ